MAFDQRRVAAAASVTAACFLACAAAEAEPTASDRETARALMNLGDRRLAEKDLAAALKAYEGADAIMHVPSTGDAVAQVQERMGLLVEARDKAVLVTRIPLSPNGPRPFVEAHADAERLARDIEHRIPSVQIVISGLDAGVDVAVTLDGATVLPSLLSLPYKADPGKHVLHASAPGYADATQEFTLAEGDTINAKLTLVPLPQARSVAAKPSQAAGAREVSAPRKTSPLVYIGFAAGGVGLVTGVATGLVQLADVSKVKTDYCGGGTACKNGYQSPTSDAKTLAAVSDIAFAVGAIGVGVGIYGLLAGHPSSSESSDVAPSGVAWHAVIGPGDLGIAGTF